MRPLSVSARGSSDPAAGGGGSAEELAKATGAREIVRPRAGEVSAEKHLIGLQDGADTRGLGTGRTLDFTPGSCVLPRRAAVTLRRRSSHSVLAWLSFSSDTHMHVGFRIKSHIVPSLNTSYANNTTTKSGPFFVGSQVLTAWVMLCQSARRSIAVPRRLRQQLWSLVPLHCRVPTVTVTVLSGSSSRRVRLSYHRPATGPTPCHCQLSLACREARSENSSFHSSTNAKPRWEINPEVKRQVTRRKGDPDPTLTRRSLRSMGLSTNGHVPKLC